MTSNYRQTSAYNFQKLSSPNPVGKLPPSLEAPILQSLTKIPYQNTSNGHGTSGNSSFTCFPELPFELRALVWERVEQKPRPIYVRTAGHQGSPLYIFCYFPVPALLHTNRETREIALKSNILISNERPIYVNLSVDVLCFDDERFFAQFTGFENPKASKISVDSRILTNQYLWRELKYLVLDHNPRVKGNINDITWSKVAGNIKRLENLQCLAINGLNIDNVLAHACWQRLLRTIWNVDDSPLIVAELDRDEMVKVIYFGESDILMSRLSLVPSLKHN